MRLTFLGGADEIGASSALLEIGNKRFLIDAGIRINNRKDREKNPDFSDIGKIDAVLLTHAHTDHSGALPVANRYTKNAPIFMTAGSYQLCDVLFKDAVKIMTKYGKEGEVPIYDEREVALTFKNIKTVEFRKPVVIGDSVKVTFFPAGHIFGAACVYLESMEGNILFTGDFSTTEQLAVSRAMITASPDVVVAEATYGDRKHIDRKSLEHQCVLKTKEVLERGGKIIIPAFAVGRSQEMILLLNDAISKQIIPNVSIYVDGMVNSVCRVYETNPESLPNNLRAKAQAHSIFNTGSIKKVMPAMRERIAKSDKPCIIISSSGMLIGGPSVFYAKEMLKHKKNALFLSGYQDEESPGRRLLELKTGQKLQLDGKTVRVEAEIYKFGFSAHADANRIVSFVDGLNPDDIVLVHGEGSARKTLAKRFPEKNVWLPTLPDNQSLTFEKKNSSFSVSVSSNKETHVKPTIEDFWRKCLLEGTKTVSLKDLEQRFPNKENKIDGFSGLQLDPVSRKHYVVVSPEKREKVLRRYNLFESLGNINGRLLIYQTGGACHLAFCRKREPQYLAFCLLSTKKKKAKTRIDVENIVYVLETKHGERYEGLDDSSILTDLRALKSVSETKVREYRRFFLLDGGNFTCRQAMEHVAVTGITTGDMITDEIAVILALFPISKIKDGVFIINKDNQEKSKPVSKFVPVNVIQDTLLKSLKKLQLKKVGYKNYTFILHFDFPEAIDKKAVMDIANSRVPKEYRVEVSNKTNQAAFNSFLFEYLGTTGKLSVFTDKKSVVVKEVQKPISKDFVKQFFKITGYTLEVKNSVNSSARPKTKPVNQQAVLMAAMECVPGIFKGIVKLGLRDDTVLVKADFPDVLLRDCPQLLENIQSTVGLKATIREYPNTNMLFALLKSKIDFEGHPSVDLENRIVRLNVPSISNDLVEEIEWKTGFKAVIEK